MDSKPRVSSKKKIASTIKLPKRWPSNQGQAAFSTCGLYRWWLSRRWDFTRRREIAFIGLNPSTADAETDDPTVGRCIRRAMRLGYSGMWMLNAFAFRATNPKHMMQQRDPVGLMNDREIMKICRMEAVETVVLCWGSIGRMSGRSQDLLELLKPVAHKLHCLGLTRGGEPRHPLYLADETELIKWQDRNDISRPGVHAEPSGMSANSRQRPRSRRPA